eukprot:2408852-Rhodomonas_salina.2
MQQGHRDDENRDATEGALVTVRHVICGYKSWSENPAKPHSRVAPGPEHLVLLLMAGRQLSRSLRPTFRRRVYSNAALSCASSDKATFYSARFVILQLRQFAWTNLWVAAGMILTLDGDGVLTASQNKKSCRPGA